MSQPLSLICSDSNRESNNWQEDQDLPKRSRRDSPRSAKWIMNLCVSSALALGAALIGPLPANAAPAWSTPGTGYPTDGITAMTFDSAGTLYAGTRECDVYSYDGASWTSLGTPNTSTCGSGNTAIGALAVASNGDLYAGGQFTNANGDEYVAKWDGSSWSQVGEAFDSAIYALAFDSSGRLYAGGNFIQTIPGSTAVPKAARWTGLAWESIGNPGGLVEDLAFNPSTGDLYAALRDVSSPYSNNGVAVWNGASSWSQLGSLGRPVYDLEFDSSNSLYASGQNVAALSSSVYSWDGSAWSGVGTGMTSNAIDIAFGPSDELYAVTYRNYVIYELSGGAWGVLAEGFTNNGSPASTGLSIAVDSSGNVFASGFFNEAGGVSADKFARYGSTSSDSSTPTQGQPNYTFTFLTSGGGTCLADVTVRRFEQFTLPPSSAACTPLGTTMAGWSIPGQDWAFAPGRVVTVVESQVFTAVAREPDITITYDANVGMDHQCTTDAGNTQQASDRFSTIQTPREGVTAQLSTTAPCTPPGFALAGWTDANTPDGSGQAQQGAAIYAPGSAIPEAWNLQDPNAVNEIHLYALWERSTAEK